MKIWAAFIALSVVLSACSEAHIPQRSRVASGELVTCRQVTPTGSHMPKTICTSAAQRKRLEEESQAMIEEERRRRAAEDVVRQGMHRDPGRP